MKKRILLVAFYFPPLGGGGSQRPLKFFKYLNRDKYNVEVITVNPYFIRYIKDRSLLRDIHYKNNIKRVFIPDISFIKNIFNLGKHSPSFNSFKLFSNSLKHHLKNKIVKGYFDSFIITVPPFEILETIKELKKLNYKIQIILDLRDFPLQNEKYKPNSIKKYITYSDKIICVSNGMKTDTLKLCHKPIYTISNGYDEDDFLINVKGKQHKKRMDIVYTGTFYGERDPTTFFDILKELHDSKNYNLKLHIYGNNYIPELRDKKYRSFVQFYGYKSHEQSIRAIINADVLLLYIASNGKNVITGKIFEYLYSGKTIFFIGPDKCEAKEILQMSGNAIINQHDKEMIRNNIIDLYNKWYNGNLSFDSNELYIERFSRRYLTKKLEEVIES